MPNFFTQYFFLASLIGYLMGSVPYGLLLTRLKGIKNLQSKGSGNIGATNVYRVGGKKLGALTLFLDFLKGVITVVLCSYLDLNIYVAGTMCVLGHIFPIWLKFKGGKGVATYIGVVFAWGWLPGFLAVLVWVSTLFISRLSSLAGITGVISTLIFLSFWPSGLALLFAIPTVFLIIIKHRTNIKRLVMGKEKRF